MASATTEPVVHGPRDEADRIAELEARLEHSERRRRATEEWATFLERELVARDDRLEEVITHYEYLLEQAKAEDEPAPEPPGLWSRVLAALPGVRRY